MTDMKPNPGSPEAVAQGCTCARMDNCHGRGFGEDGDGNRLFYISEGCPLHDPAYTAAGRAAVADDGAGTPK